jgi:arylamine N-acetyltransferase
LTDVLDVHAYLRRLGLEHPGPPSVAGLFAIHRAQVERVAYSTVDIYRGRPPSIDPYESAARVAATGRGGYCYHLNGALSVVLAELGFDVHRHRGFVWKQPEEVPRKPYANHLALTVHGRRPRPTRVGRGWSTPGWATRCTSRPRCAAVR